MRFFPLPYIVWVLTPVALLVLLGQSLASRETEARTQVTASRVGRLATHLFAEEMGRKAAEMVRDAPVLTNPDPNSPLVQAAQRGDTVAALGHSSGTLTLSVALADGGSDPPTIRATTAAFPAETPNLVSSRTGFGVALYLRGKRALTSSQAFGPEEITDSGAFASSAPTPLPEGSTLLPLAASAGRAPSPAQLLVGPPQAPEADDSLWTTLLGILVGLGLGSFILFRGSGSGPHSTRSLLILTGIPLTILWVFLLSTGNRVEEEAEDSLREDMVRALALLKEADGSLTPEVLLEATGFHLLRRDGGRVLETNLPEGVLREELLALPLPPPTFPALGTIRDEGNETVYAHLRVASGGAVLLTAPSTTEAQRGFTILLSVLGGVASLLSLGFLFHHKKRLDH